MKLFKYWQLLVYLGSLLVGVGITLAAVSDGKTERNELKVRVLKLESDREVLVRIDERNRNIVERLDRMERKLDAR